MNHLNYLKKVIFLETLEVLRELIHVNLFHTSVKELMLEQQYTVTPLSTRFFFLADSSPVRFLPFSSPGTGPDSLNFSRRADFGFLNA